MIRLLFHAGARLRRAVLGLSPDDIRYTFEDVRREIRDARAEIRSEIAAIRRDLAELRASATPGRSARRGTQARPEPAEDQAPEASPSPARARDARRPRRRRS